jgi:cell wall-associated NlpC family hydrolase
MRRGSIVLSLLLLTFNADADTKRREPSLFLEYERELKKVNDSFSHDETAFIKAPPSLAIAKPLPPSEPILKAAPITESTVLKNTKSEAEPIGRDSNPFLVVPQPAPPTQPHIIKEEPKVAEAPKNAPQKIITNLQSVKDKVLARAKNFLGTPYGFGNKDGERTDCSGFTQQVYRQFGVSLPRSAAEQAQMGVSVNPNDLQIGDLLFYRTYKSDPSHVAIYAGNGKIIHASYTAKKVQYDSIEKAYYRDRFMYAKRLNFNDPDYDE